MYLRATLLVCGIAIFAGEVHGADYRKLFQQSDPAVVVLHTIERSVVPDARSLEVVLPGLGSGSDTQ